MDKRFLLLGWFILSLVVIFADYAAGPVIQFPILFIFPIALATWHNGRRWGLVLSFSLPLWRIFFTLFSGTPWLLHEIILNALIRAAVFASIVMLLDREKQRRTLLREIKILRGLLPICSFCKKIRTDHQNWVFLETYIHDHSEAQFSHGICPDCSQRHFGQGKEK